MQITAISLPLNKTDVNIPAVYQKVLGLQNKILVLIFIKLYIYDSKSTIWI